MGKKDMGPRFYFGPVGLHKGDVIDFREDVYLYDRSELYVVDGPKLEVLCTYSGEVETLREWTRRLLTKAGIPYREDRLEPKRYWEYKGIRLKKLYEQWRHDTHPIKLEQEGGHYV